MGKKTPQLFAGVLLIRIFSAFYVPIFTSDFSKIPLMSVQFFQLTFQCQG